MKNWNSACFASIRKEKAEISKRYNIRFGQTEIYCNDCGSPVGNPINHICQNIRLKMIREGKKSRFKGIQALMEG